MKEPNIRFLTGGEIQIRGRIDAVSGVNSAALLIMLALNRQEVLSREYLATVIWPDADAATARQRLRMTLLKLRSQMMPELGEKLAATKENICLQIEPEDIDVAIFEKLAASDRPEHRLQAIELYRGDLLSRFPEISESFDIFIGHHRSDLRTRFVMLCRSFLEASDPTVNDEFVEKALKAALRIDPTNPEFVASALRFYGRIGSMQLINECFETYQRAIAHELDEEPDPKIIALRKELMNSDKNTEATTRSIERPGTTSERTAPHAEPPYKENSLILTKLNRKHSVIIGLVCILAALAVYWATFRTKTDRIFILERPEISTPECATSDVTRNFESAVQQALLGIKKSVVVMSAEHRLDANELGTEYVVERLAICDGVNSRGTLTVSRKTNREVLFVRRYNLHGGSEKDLVHVIASDLDQISF